MGCLVATRRWVATAMSRAPTGAVGAARRPDPVILGRSCRPTGAPRQTARLRSARSAHTPDLALPCSSPPVRSFGTPTPRHAQRRLPLYIQGCSCSIASRPRHDACPDSCRAARSATRRSCELTRVAAQVMRSSGGPHSVSETVPLRLLNHDIFVGLWPPLCICC